MSYTAAAKAALKVSGGLKPITPNAAPQPRNTAPRPAGPRAGKPQPAAPRAGAKPTAKHPAPAKPQAAAARQALANTGPYSEAFNALDQEDAATTDIERRRLNDNLAYQKWLGDNNAKQAGDLRAADVAVDSRQQAAQAATAQAQAATQATLDAQRAGRSGTVTDGPGNSRARLAGDDTLTNTLLGAQRESSAITAQSSQHKQDFLSAATAATGAADAARIRGEAGQARTATGQRRTDLSIRKEDTLSAERAAKAQAAADAVKAQADAEMAQRAIDSRLAIAEATIGARSSEGAADRDLRASEGAANRDVTLRTTAARIAAQERERKNGKAGTSDAERRARAKDVRTLDNAVSSATANARSYVNAARKKGKPLPAPNDVRALLNEDFPGISTEAVEAAIDAAYPVTPARRKKNRKKLDTARRNLAKGG